MNFERAAFIYRWFIRLARYAAPKPLSMFTTATPLAHELSMPSSAAMPPKLARGQMSTARGFRVQVEYLKRPRPGWAGDPVDHRGRTWHNQVAFVDDGDAVNRTVGRAHASIRYELSRSEHRLFDDGSHNGTQVVRDGVVMDVTPRDPTGVVLMSGDEVRLGKAAIRIRVEPPPRAGAWSVVTARDLRAQSSY